MERWRGKEEGRERAEGGKGVRRKKEWRESGEREKGRGGKETLGRREVERERGGEEREVEMEGGTRGGVCRARTYMYGFCITKSENFKKISDLNKQPLT